MKLILRIAGQLREIETRDARITLLSEEKGSYHIPFEPSLPPGEPEPDLDVVEYLPNGTIRRTWWRLREE